MSADKALRQVVADKLGIDPSEMESVEVTWDDGDRYDPTYGDSGNAVPTFEIQVRLTGNRWVYLDTAWTFSALLAAMLGVKVRP